MAPHRAETQETETGVRPQAEDEGEAPGVAYLLVVDGASSRRYLLKRDGVLVVGRSHEADVRIDTAAVSRKHAKVFTASGKVLVADLGSHNGTLVNGERVTGTRALSSGDVVAVGDAILVLRCEPRAAPHAVIVMDQLRRRLEEELERAADYSRPLAVAMVNLGGEVSSAARAEVGSKAAAALRLIDVLAWDGGAQLAVLLPELDGEAARAAVQELLGALGPLAPEARGGVAAYPADGCDAETLLSGARAAAGMAAGGAVAAAAEAVVRHALGGREVLVADAAMIRVFELIRRLSASDLPVLVQGETGAGKENVAAALHHWSARAGRPLVPVNCAAIPETLVESTLFGHERGAFTGATQQQKGVFEAANGGTVFLDEVGELPLAIQAKLLRALEAKRITRLGDRQEREVDIRVVAATNRDLEAECKAGRFREDLLFRLGAALVVLPPLRHRPREVPILARLFLAEACTRAGRPPLVLSEAALGKLGTYEFPGNVRELKNAMDYAAATANGPEVELWDLPERISGRPAVSLASASGAPASGAPASGAPASSAPPGALPRPARVPGRFRPVAEELKELERTRMQEALEAACGVQARAAELIGMPIRTFSFKMKQYGISATLRRRP